MRQLSYQYLFGFLVAAILHPAAVFAWGGEGHQVVALIAERHLTEEAQKQIHELLDGADISDAEIASWADEIKRQRIRTAPWHYVDIPLDAEGYDEKRDDPTGNHIICRIEKFEEMLANKHMSKQARAEALKYLVHLIGDLHQPLHTTERNGDKGGNELKVQFLKKKSDLHKVWDTLLLREYIGKQRIAEYAEVLDKKTDDVEVAAWRKGSFVDWINEAWIIARDLIYEGMPTEDVTLDADYVERSRDVVETQLRRCGVRLADVLNRSLTK